MNTSPLLSFWLLPAGDDRATLQSIIHQLAHQYGAVEFCPHVTLFTIPTLSVLARHSAVDRLPSKALSSIDWETCLQPGIAMLQPLSLTVQEVCSGPEFAKTVFIRLNTTPALLATIRHLQQTVSQSSSTITSDLDPHISLIYQTLDAETKDAIAQSIQIPTNIIYFDEIQIIQAPPQFETSGDARQLRCLYSQTLTNSS